MGCKDDLGPQGPDSKPGPPDLEDSLREILEHGMENFFQKKKKTNRIQRKMENVFNLSVCLCKPKELNRGPHWMDAFPFQNGGRFKGI